MDTIDTHIHALTVCSSLWTHVTCHRDIHTYVYTYIRTYIHTYMHLLYVGPCGPTLCTTVAHIQIYIYPYTDCMSALAGTHYVQQRHTYKHTYVHTLMHTYIHLLYVGPCGHTLRATEACVRGWGTLSNSDGDEDAITASAIASRKNPDLPSSSVVCTYTRWCMCACTCMYVCMYVCMNVCGCMHTCTPYTNTYMNTYIHTYRSSQSGC
jgi:hypothetical protein